MIVSIKIQNFLSFGNETITLRPDSNLLAGINGSGKSNFLQAVRLLKAAVSERNGLQTLLAELGGIDEVLNLGSETQEMILTYKLDRNVLKDYINMDTLKKYLEKNLFSEDLKNLDIDDFITKFPEDMEYKIKIIKTNDKNNRFEVIHEIEGEEMKEGRVYHNPNGNLYKLRSLIFINGIDFYGFLRTAIENIDIYNYFDTSPKSPLRRPIIDTSFENKLVSGGLNLPQILNQLSINHLDAFDKITEELQTVNPNFKEIRFNYLGSTILMTLREKSLKSTVNCNMLSDGTLRYLCLLAILCNPTPSSLICLDEPELGLHPDMIATLARLIKEKSRTTQIIIITHSPLLLNHFDFENVLFFEKDEDKNTTQKRYNADDFPDGEMVGSLWMKGYLGGRRW